MLTHSHQRALLPLAIVTMLVLVAMSSSAQWSSLGYVRMRGILTGGSATRAAMLGAVASGQIRTIVLWLTASAILCLLLRICLPASTSSFARCLGVVGLSHFPLVIWTAFAVLITSEAIGVLDGFSRVMHWPPTIVAASVTRLMDLLWWTKAAAYVATAAVCARLVAQSERVSVRQSAGIVTATIAGILVINWLG